MSLKRTWTCARGVFKHYLLGKHHQRRWRILISRSGHQLLNFRNFHLYSRSPTQYYHECTIQTHTKSSYILRRPQVFFFSWESCTLNLTRWNSLPILFLFLTFIIDLFTWLLFFIRSSNRSRAQFKWDANLKSETLAAESYYMVNSYFGM